LKHAQNEILKFLVDGMVFGLFVDVFHVGDNATVEESSQLFILAFKKLQEDGKDSRGGNYFFSAHNLQGSHKTHADFGV
jgi:hypothetical protein